MDEEWRAIHLQRCFYIKPSVWRPEDWVRLVGAVVVLLVGIRWFARDSARLLLAGWAVAQ